MKRFARSHALKINVLLVVVFTLIGVFLAGKLPNESSIETAYFKGILVPGEELYSFEGTSYYVTIRENAVVVVDDTLISVLESQQFESPRYVKNVSSKPIRIQVWSVQQSVSIKFKQTISEDLIILYKTLLVVIMPLLSGMLILLKDILVEEERCLA